MFWAEYSFTPERGRAIRLNDEIDLVVLYPLNLQVEEFASYLEMLDLLCEEEHRVEPGCKHRERWIKHCDVEQWAVSVVKSHRDYHFEQQYNEFKVHNVEPNSQWWWRAAHAE